MTDALEILRAELPEVAWSSAPTPPALEPLAAPGAPLDELREALRDAARPLILVNDASRLLPVGLPDVLADLREASAGRARVLVATGTHTGKGPELYAQRLGLPVEVHEARDADAHGDLDGWSFDRRVLDADVVLAVGSVEPHYFAGWTGAHKTLTVGVWALETTARNHRLALEVTAQPMARWGNPVFEDVAAAATRLAASRRVVVLDQVLDEAARPIAAAVGTWEEGLDGVLAAAQRAFTRTIPAPVDVVVARVEGPLAASLYQADKGVKNTEAVVRDGGDLILEAELPEGAGPDRFLTLLRAAPDLTAAREHVAREGYLLGDHKAVRWRALEARGVRVRVVSPRLEPAALEGTGIPLHRTLTEACTAIRERRQGAGGPERGLVVDDAGMVVPVCEGDAGSGCLGD